MNIILLSGVLENAYGHYLMMFDPSNLLSFLKDDDGEYESMVQRVYRQITAVDNNAKITIATSKSQASAIKNQLGDKTSICGTV